MLSESLPSLFLRNTPEKERERERGRERALCGRRR
jgi:hypothetical protein